MATGLVFTLITSSLIEEVARSIRREFRYYNFLRACQNEGYYYETTKVN